MNAEENMAACYLRFHSVNSGILTTGEFTDDAIHCKLQSLLEHLYSALFIFCLV